mmetsp:Transcript_15402/g.58603  ORF Transcript_15402/g.58603 Transcript_15402/m.58603 type:complete len:240 (+) Transcript_15402:259-978(+)
MISAPRSITSAGAVLVSVPSSLYPRMVAPASMVRTAPLLTNTWQVSRDASSALQVASEMMLPHRTWPPTLSGSSWLSSSQDRLDNHRSESLKAPLKETSSKKELPTVLMSSTSLKAFPPRMGRGSKNGVSVLGFPTSMIGSGSTLRAVNVGFVAQPVLSTCTPPPLPVKMMLLGEKYSTSRDVTWLMSCVKSSSSQLFWKSPALPTLVTMRFPNTPPVPSRSRRTAGVSSSELTEPTAF